MHKFSEAIDGAVYILSNGAKKVNYEISIDEQVIAELSGYWVGELMRIDVKFKE
jgi:hypothetical protein